MRRLSACNDLMRRARRNGATIDRALTRYDEARGGRVQVLELFWPGSSGYDEVEP